MIEPTPLSRRVAAALVIAYAIIATIPLVWIFMTGFKTPSDAIAYPPKVIFEPSLEGYVNLFTEPHPPDAASTWRACRRPRPGTRSWCARATW